MEILSSLGIHWTSFLAQILNFGILVFVLTKLVYKPLMSALEKREEMIKKISDESHGAKKIYDEAQEKHDQILAEARKKVAALFSESENQALALKQNIIEEAKKDAERIIKEGERKMMEDQEKFDSDLRTHLLALVSEGIEKTVSKYIGKDASEKLKHEAVEASLKASEEKKK